MTTGTADTAPAAAAAEFNEVGADYAPFGFTMLAQVLQGLCAEAARVVPSTDFQPVLTGFMVQVAPGSIRLAATDMDLAVVTTSPAISTEGEARVLLPARRLLDILATIETGDITFAVAHDRADITAGTATWSLRLPDGSDYPDLPDVATLGMSEVSRAKFLAALRLVHHAVGREGGRPALQQVVIAPGTNGQRQLTACDSARLAQVPVDFPFDAAVPRGAVDELVHMLDGSTEATLQAAAGEAGQLVFRLADTVFTTQPAPAKFPDVEKALLKPSLANSQVLHVGRTALADAIRRVRITADPNTSAIALRLSKSQCEVISQDKGGNRASQPLPATWTGPERTIVASHRHLADPLAVGQDEIAVLKLGPDQAKRKSAVLYQDSATGLSAVISQMLGSMLGY